MGAYLQYGLTSMRFDVVTNETHRFSAAVTEFPVELGPNVTDNVRAELDTVNLEVFVSNSPISVNSLLQDNPRGVYKDLKLDIPQYKAPFDATPGAVFRAAGGLVGSLIGSNKKQDGALTLQFSQEFNSVSEIFSELRRLRDTAQIVKVITPHWDYEAMVIVSVEMPRTSAEGDSARISIELRQILQVETKRTTEPVPTQARGKSKKKKGTKGPTTPLQGASTAFLGREALTNWFKGQ